SGSRHRTTPGSARQVDKWRTRDLSSGKKSPAPGPGERPFGDSEGPFSWSRRMLSAETPPTEGARYAAGLVCIPGLWAGSGVWRGFASHLGHRGWECHLLDVRGVAGGLAARAAAV